MEPRSPLRIGISCGDLNGIGIEVVLKCFLDTRMMTDLTPVLYASSQAVSHHRKALKLDESQFNRVADAREARDVRRDRDARIDEHGEPPALRAGGFAPPVRA